MEDQVNMIVVKEESESSNITINIMEDQEVNVTVSSKKPVKVIVKKESQSCKRVLEALLVLCLLLLIFVALKTLPFDGKFVAQYRTFLMNFLIFSIFCELFL
jgi:hypothetical protein